MNALDEREARFRSAFLATHDDLLRFVQRRTYARDGAASAEDVVAETMLTAWRRVDDLPGEAGEARAWLFGIARHVLLNDSRTHRRADALAVRLADVRGAGTHPDSADDVAQRVDLARAWKRLTAEQQETIALIVLDGLDSTGAGAVLGISAGAYRLRLSRARAALRDHMSGQSAHATRETSAIPLPTHPPAQAAAPTTASAPATEVLP